MAFIIFFFKKLKRIEKIGYDSNFNFEYNSEKGFKESLSIALGIKVSTNLKASVKISGETLENEDILTLSTYDFST